MKQRKVEREEKLCKGKGMDGKGRWIKVKGMREENERGRGRIENGEGKRWGRKK